MAEILNRRPGCSDSGVGGTSGGSLADHAHGADISAIVRMSAAPGVEVGEQRSCASEFADPGPIPDHLFRVPGFVSRVMDFTLTHAPYPNAGLAFCGAVAAWRCRTASGAADRCGPLPSDRP